MKRALFIFSVWNFLKTIFAFAVSVVLFLSIVLLSATAFPFVGQKEYYLSSATSQCLIKPCLILTDLPFLRGESIRVTLDDETANSQQAYLNELLEVYKATILKVETFEDSVSYYCYSARFRQGVSLDGVTVNLHIVVKDREMVVGTPLVFGGY